MASRRYNKRWTPEYAAELLTAAAQSGLSDRAFAKHRGIDPRRLWWWRKRLGHQKAEQTRASFVEVAVRSPSAPAAGGRVEILLSNGRIVAAPLDVEPSKLGRLLDAIEGRPC